MADVEGVGGSGAAESTSGADGSGTMKQPTVSEDDRKKLQTLGISQSAQDGNFYQNSVLMTGQNGQPKTLDQIKAEHPDTFPSAGGAADGANGLATGVSAGADSAPPPVNQQA